MADYDSWRIHRRTTPIVARLLPLLAVAACGGDAQGAAEPSPAALTSAADIPSADDPGHGALEDVRVGADASGRFALALARTREGAWIAYACDGQRVGAWYAAGASADSQGLSLTGREGELRLTTLLHGAARAEARLAGDSLVFELEPANEYAGMYRFTEQDDDGAEYQAGWVVLNDGRLFGVDSGGGAVKSRETTSTVSEDVIEGGTSGTGGGVETDEYIFNRFRCGRLLLKWDRALAATGGPGFIGSPFHNEFLDSYTALGCENLGFPDWTWMEGKPGGSQ